MTLFDDFWARVCVYMKLLAYNGVPTKFQSDLYQWAHYQSAIHADSVKRDKNYVGDFVWKHDIRKEHP